MIMNKKLDNLVIEAETRFHGREIIDFWKSQGVKTSMNGSLNKFEGNSNRFYGFVDGSFSAYNFEDLKKSRNNIRISTINQARKILELSDFPKLMMVSDVENFKSGPVRLVVGKFNGKYLAVLESSIDAATINKNTKYALWDYAKDIESFKPKTVELSLKEIAEKLNIPVDQLRIKEEN